MAQIDHKENSPKKSITSTRSNQPNQPNQPNPSPNPPHLTPTNLLVHPKIQLSPQFRANIDLQVLDTNFQSMRVRMHYGWYLTEVSVLYTEIDQRVFEDEVEERGAFGVVRFVEVEGRSYAVKGVELEYLQGDIDTRNAYRQYFLTLIAGILEIGPQICPVFGYDMVLTKKMVFFGMEKCQQITDQGINTIQAELQKNLQKMHSQNFVHIDIKPQNIAYSPSLKKCIFIDFGMSRVLQQPIGHKSKTKFAGTLSYCSEQMKKCYIFQAPQFVDLYENDWVCLGKCLRVFLKCLAGRKIMGNGNGNGNGNGIGIEKEKEEKDEDVGIFGQTVEVIRLKYWIQQNNVNEIIKALKKIDSIRLTIHQIFSNPNLPKSISQHPQIQKTLQKNRTQIFTKSSQIPKIDSTLSTFFSDSQRAVCAQKIIPVSQIIHSTEIFNRYLDQPELLLKLYYFLEPWRKEVGMIIDGEIGGIEGGIEVRRVIVERIWKRKVKNASEPVFFSEKVRSVLIYFYDNLKTLKNYKVLISLRLLFFSIQQWSYANALQSDILQSSPTPFHNLLKLTEFSLYHDLQPDTHEFPRKQHYKQIADSVPIDEGNVREVKMKEIFQFVVRAKGDYMGCRRGEDRGRIREIIWEVWGECLGEGDAEERVGVGLVGVLFGEICGVRDPLAEGHQSIELYIYSTHHLTLQSTPTTPLPYLHLFQPPQTQLKSLPPTAPTNQMIQNFIEHSIQRNKFIGNVIKRVLSFGRTVVGKKEMGVFVGAVRRNVERGTCGEEVGKEGKEDRERQGKQESEGKGKGKGRCWIDCMVYSIVCCLEILKDGRPEEVQKISKQDKKLFISELSSIFLNLLQNPITKQTLPTSKQLQASILILQSKFALLHNTPPHKIQPSLQQILPLLQPLPHPRFSLIYRFLSLIISLLPSVPQSPHSISAKQCLVYIMQKYLQHNNYELFQLDQHVGTFIRVRNQMGREMENLGMILRIAEGFRDRDRERDRERERKRLGEGQRKAVGQVGGIGKMTKFVYVRVVEVFCRSVQVQKLVGIYWQVKNMGMEFSCQLIAYLIFTIFLQIKDKLPPTTQVHQLTKSTLPVPKMHPVLSLSVRPHLFRLYKNLINFKSKRKAYICKKLEIRNTANQRKIKGFVRDFGRKVGKIGGFWGKLEVVREKLDWKIGILQKI